MMERETLKRRKRSVRVGKSGSGLFLMEMIVAVFFFMVCASICILAFAKSDSISRRAKNLNQAVLAAESTAEVWKASGVDGLETELGFAPEIPGDESALTAVHDSFVVRVELSTENQGMTEAAIHVRPAHPALSDPDEIFRLETRRYER
jgi:hypothetical protein